MNINPPLDFMNSFRFEFLFIAESLLAVNNGPISRSQNPSVNTSHSICVEKLQHLCIGQFEFGNIFFFSTSIIFGSGDLVRQSDPE